MITGLQLALAGGLLVGCGVALLLSRLMHADPSLDDVMDRLSPQHAQRRRQATTAQEALDRHDKLGIWAIKHVPVSAWGKTPTKELALLQIPMQRHYGKKIAYALTGLLMPPLLTFFAAVVGFTVPFIVPAAGSLALAALLFMAPDSDVRADAKKARAEFSRALGAYIDLVALERASGTGPRQALEVAAGVGDSWVFRRIGEELARSRWSGQTPWDALNGLSDELGLPELADLADIMRLSGEQSAQVYASLRARSSAMRNAC